MPNRIEDYALIGDCETAALVGRDGSIDWLCLPRFDRDACFAALLGGPDNGRWRICAADDRAKVTRRYRGDTLILETDFETADGAATIIDFMPVRSHAPHLIRIVQGRRGSLAMCGELIVRFGFGRDVPWVTRRNDGALTMIAGPDMAVLRSDAPLEGVDLTTLSAFTIKEGQTIRFVLSYGASHQEPPKSIDPIHALNETERFWRRWIGRYKGHGRWADAVRRSLITLKALTYQPSGGMVAAPTTSLPETLQGERNWDYRYCWLRDSTFTLLTLMNAGYYEEADAWRGWLLRALAGTPSQVQIMYGITGERRLQEWSADWLAGYEGARPVRIGNAASEQLQIDIYGEVMDALYHGRKGRLASDEAGWALQCAMLEHLESVWREPDQGIWEVRSGPENFTHSKVMAWVAFDRAIRSVEEFGLDGPIERWRKCCAEIRSEILSRGYDAEKRSFVRSFESRALDASLLIMTQVGFLPPEDPRIQGTLAAIERELKQDGLIRRYDTDCAEDGLSSPEGAFLACSFWYADNLILAGRRSEAEAMFKYLLGLRNDVGLLAEQYDPRIGRQLGNFPQALSHIALITTADNLDREVKPSEQRSGSEASPRPA